MLNFLRDWIKNIVLLMFLAGLMEMLIPTGEMRKFIQVVVGLFIIMTILNPILAFMRQEVAWQPLSWSHNLTARQDITQIIQQGELVAVTGQEQALVHYRYQLEEQVRVIVMGIADVKSTRVEILLETDPKAADFGAVRGIKVWVDGGIKEEVVSVVKPIEVKVGTEEQQKKVDQQISLVPPKLQQQVVAVLNTFYSLDPENIYILDWEQEG